jgi:hypothetical protein
LKGQSGIHRQTLVIVVLVRSNFDGTAVLIVIYRTRSDVATKQVITEEQTFVKVVERFMALVPKDGLLVAIDLRIAVHIFVAVEILYTRRISMRTLRNHDQLTSSSSSSMSPISRGPPNADKEVNTGFQTLLKWRDRIP